MSSDPRPFTAGAVPEAEARVARDVVRLAAAFTAAVPQLDALVLVGAFGRGEGSMVHDAGGWRPLNDYDLVLVHRGPAPDVDAVRRALAAELGFDHLDVEVLESSHLARLPASMHAYDLKYGGRVIAGDARALERIPPIAAEQVDLATARLLLFNRLTCLLEGVTSDDLTGPPAPARRLRMAYLAHKVVLAVATSRLARAGLHDVRYAERARRFASRFASEPALVALVEAATRFKLAPPAEVADPRALWFDARDAYLAEIAQVLALTHGRRFADWRDFARVHEGDRALDRLRKVRWWLFDRRKLADIEGWELRVDVELAELFLIAAPARDGGFDGPLVAAAAARLARHAGEPLAGFEPCRSAAVRLDLAFLHPA